MTRPSPLPLTHDQYQFAMRAVKGKALEPTAERGQTRGVRVGHHPAAVAQARAAVRDDIKALVSEETVAEAEIVVSELLGNAIRHARPVDAGTRLRWHVRGKTVDIEVTDGGAKIPERDRGIRPLRPPIEATHGRGLRIVRSVAHEWGVYEDADGNRTVWAAVGGPTKRRRRD